MPKSLAELLRDMNRETRADGYAAFADLLHRISEQAEPVDPRLAMTSRVLKVMLTATVEAGEIERAWNNGPEDFLPMAARAAGYAVCAAMCSLNPDKPPPERMAIMLAKEFKFGALEMLASFERTQA